MLSGIWVALMVLGVAVAGMGGKAADITDAAFQAGKGAVEMMMGLAGMMALWMGLMRIAEESGLTASLARLLTPLVSRLFPTIPRNHPAVGAMVMNVSANMLGLGSAATPFGLKAMQHLQDLNEDKETASEAMCTFLVLNTSSITLIPGTIIALRAAADSVNPAEIVSATLLASAAAGVVGISLDFGVRAWHRWRGR